MYMNNTVISLPIRCIVDNNFGLITNSEKVRCESNQPILMNFRVFITKWINDTYIVYNYKWHRKNRQFFYLKSLTVVLKMLVFIQIKLYINGSKKYKLLTTHCI